MLLCAALVVASLINIKLYYELNDKYSFFIKEEIIDKRKIISELIESSLAFLPAGILSLIYILL
ncbi:MAG: hypothetical protein QMD50_00345 [Patescibacteria group bacterium]|nr:hypothetical protein [Patescibacteria group bacterium]